MFSRRIGVLTLLVFALTAWSPPQDTPGQAVATVVRFPPSKFPSLPRPIASDLLKRGCRIPQKANLPPKSSPVNVVKGQFLVRGRDDWAVLCSIQDTSRILVYHGAVPTPIDSLGKSADLHALTTSKFGYSRVITEANRRRLRQVASLRQSIRFPRFDHSGIEDNVAGISEVRYFSDGRWMNLLGRVE
jgi:hypothetical protein